MITTEEKKAYLVRAREKMMSNAYKAWYARHKCAGATYCIRASMSIAKSGKRKLGQRKCQGCIYLRSIVDEQYRTVTVTEGRKHD